MNLDFCWGTHMVGQAAWIHGLNLPCLRVVSVTLGPLIPINHDLNSTAYLSILATIKHLLMAASSMIMQHKAKLVSNWFHKHGRVQCTSMASPVNRSESNKTHFGMCVKRETSSMNVQLTNLQKLCDAVLSTWSRISKENFQYLVKSTAPRTEAVLRANRGPSSISTVFPIKWTLSVHSSQQ